MFGSYSRGGCSLFVGGQKFQRSGSGGEERSGGKGHCIHHDVMYERRRKVLKYCDLSFKKTFTFYFKTEPCYVDLLPSALSWPSFRPTHPHHYEDQLLPFFLTHTQY